MQADQLTEEQIAGECPTSPVTPQQPARMVHRRSTQGCSHPDQTPESPQHFDISDWSPQPTAGAAHLWHGLALLLVCHLCEGHACHRLKCPPLETPAFTPLSRPPVTGCGACDWGLISLGSHQVHSAWMLQAWERAQLCCVTSAQPGCGEAGVALPPFSPHAFPPTHTVTPM